MKLDCALAHDSSLHSAHHGAGLHRETYRHTWLLADGSALTLWELAHNTAPGGEPQHEVYVDEEELRTATARLPLPSEAPEFELPVTAVAFPLPAVRQTYASDDSPTTRAVYCAGRRTRTGRAPRRRRCCRRRARTASPRRPPGRPSRAGRTALCISLYEHAFLLGDGGEISLWEVEHTVTPDGRHMCEVYTSEDAARRAMERRAAQSC